MPDHQEPVQSDAAPSDGYGAKNAQAGRPGLEVPDFSTVSRRQKHLTVTIGAHPTARGLHLVVDSTGIKMLGEGEWKTKKHGADYRRQWRELHLGSDPSTLEIRAIEVTDVATGDAPMLPCLFDQIADDEIIASVSSDGHYNTKSCHVAIAAAVQCGPARAVRSPDRSGGGISRFDRLNF